MKRPIDTAPTTGEFITLMWMDVGVEVSTIGRWVAHAQAPNLDHWGDEIKLDWGLSPTKCNPTHWDYITEGPAMDRFGFNAARPSTLLYGIDTFTQFNNLKRGQEVFYKGLRTQVVWVHSHPQTTFVVLQNGAVLSMAPNETQHVRTYPAFGEDTSLKASF